MKSFAIFPTLSIFLLTLTLFSFSGQTGKLKIIGLTILVTSILGGLLTIYSVELFELLYYFNLISVIIIITCLTYLTNRLFPEHKKATWIRLLALGIVSTVLTVTLFLTTMLAAFIQNPMDPIDNKFQTEKVKRTAINFNWCMRIGTNPVDKGH